MENTESTENIVNTIHISTPNKGVLMDICDFHSHIMPHADHGCTSVDEALEQLKLARDNGVTRIISTSHFYPHRDSVDSFILKRDRAYASLAERMTADMPRIRLAAEVLLCANMDTMPDLERLCIRGTNVILIELPFNDFGSEYVHAVEGMIQNGYRVILAHAECYEPENIEKMLDAGALIQINASALLSIFPKRSVSGWIKRRRVIALGSDIHGADKRAYKYFRRAVKRLGGYAEYIQRKSDEIWELSI